jgi:hypothetical protein
MLRACLAALPLFAVRSAMAADSSTGGAEALPTPLAAAPDKADASGQEPVAPVKPTPPPYSLPWQLRPAAAANVVRSDTSTGFRSVNGVGGTTVATLLLASYKVTPDLSIVARGGFVDDSPPGKPAASAFLNPVLGATYVVPLGSGFRLAPFFGVAFPLGNGGGNTPDPAVRGALSSGMLTRAAMDNALFAVNYLTPFPGLDLAWMKGGLTLQAEATVFELFRARGDLVDKDAARTNLTSGLHAGYFVIPELSIGAELRYQRWLKNPGIPESDARRDNMTAAIGLRAHLKVAQGMWLRPGVAFVEPIDAPMTDQKYHVAQLDVPFAF